MGTSNRLSKGQAAASYRSRRPGASSVYSMYLPWRPHAGKLRSTLKTMVLPACTILLILNVRFLVRSLHFSLIAHFFALLTVWSVRARHEQLSGRAFQIRHFNAFGLAEIVRRIVSSSILAFLW